MAPPRFRSRTPAEQIAKRSIQTELTYFPIPQLSWKTLSCAVNKDRERAGGGVCVRVRVCVCVVEKEDIQKNKLQ